MKKYPPTPELDRMKAVKDKSQPIGEFLEWLYSQGVELAKPHEHDDCEDCGFHAGELVAINTPIEKLLAEYFEIDLKKCEEEREAILEYIRKSK